MKTLIVLSAATLVLSACASSEPAAPEFADLPPPPVEPLEKPSFFASQTQTTTAVVESINHTTREVVLRRADGEMLSFVAGDEVRNLDQVENGDVVTALIEESLSVEVMANDGLEPEAAEAETLVRTDEGEMPGVAAMDTTIITATVESINLEANTFKLKGPDGAIREYAARNPDNLRRAAVGDLVVITAVTTVAVAVDHATEVEE